jgi:hypothetical protein
MEYLRLFNKNIDYQTFVNSDDYLVPNTCLIKESNIVICKELISGSTTPDEPDTPDEPNIDSIGEVNENNEIIINEELLSPGTYTLKYIDGNDNPIDNFKPINEFTI